MGDTQTYQKLSRVYDSMMRSARFTEAQNKETEENEINSVGVLVDFVEKHSGMIPRYKCEQPQDLIDEIISDLKNYNKSLVYEDKALAQEIEKYLQDRRIAEAMKQDKQEAKRQGVEQIELTDQDYIDYKAAIRQMKEQDESLTKTAIEKDYLKKIKK